MQYYDLAAIVKSRKSSPGELDGPTTSFYQVKERPAPYIEPRLAKDDFPSEKPAIVLVSAVGASGKSTMAKALAYDTGLPILDLAKHKGVGDSTLTGLLTSAYDIHKVGPVLQGLRDGSHGVIIDGIDEGRSKTSEESFEAFLDDLVKLSAGAEATTIIVLGRSQVLLSAWCYLADCKASVGLARIEPFGMDQARQYIDAYVKLQDDQRSVYVEARDGILNQLSAAFANSHEGDSFLSFIGYPPVLDAIAALLEKERNYHRLSQGLDGEVGGLLEVRLLIRIADLLLERERKEKALPNFIEHIVDQADEETASELRERLYCKEEQCARVLARALGKSFPRQVISDDALNSEYEESLATWCPDHPFLDDGRVRNAVFVAVALARCALSSIPEHQDLAFEYAASAKLTYHLLYIMHELASDSPLGIRFFNAILQSCSDFVGREYGVNTEISGYSWDEEGLPECTPVELDVQISLPQKGQERRFVFSGTVEVCDTIRLGPFLANTVIVLPCGVHLQSTSTVDCLGYCEITAREVHVEAASLVVGNLPGDGTDDECRSGLLVDAGRVTGHAGRVTSKAAAIEVSCLQHELLYPLAQYVHKRKPSQGDPHFREKFRRLRRIMQDFASHSKGGLAKFRAKIEHERVLRGKVGQDVLSRLVNEGVLTKDKRFYYVDSAKCSEILGTSWQDLRQHTASDAIVAFLSRVP